MHYVVSAPYAKACQGRRFRSTARVEVEDAATVLGMVDALIITAAGCGSRHYTAPADPMLGRPDPHRDAADLAITRAAVHATCRHLQRAAG